MADFVAVIRRAVDGLSDNTPEMRVKVYEKARSAVLRQLEGMKPRPPEEMLRRQLEKLESAIQQVEDEHQVALPEIEEEAPEPEIPVVAAAQPEPEPEPQLVSTPEPAFEPVRQPEVHESREHQPEQPAYHEPEVMPQPVMAEPEVAQSAPDVLPAAEEVPEDPYHDAAYTEEAVLPPQVVATEPQVVEPTPVEYQPEEHQSVEPQLADTVDIPVATEAAIPAQPVEPEPALPVVPAVPAPALQPVLPAAKAGVFLFGDESWAGDEEVAASAPEAVAAPVMPEPEPMVAPVEVQPDPPQPQPEVVDAMAPPLEPVVHPSPDDGQNQLADADPYADFPVEEPTAKYSQNWQSPEEIAAAAVPEAVAWPDDGMVIEATAAPAVEEWTAPAVAVVEPIALHPVEEPQPFSLPSGSGNAQDDPFAWHAETQAERLVEPVVELVAGPVNNVIHADFTHHRQDAAEVAGDPDASGQSQAQVVLDPVIADTDLLANEDWDRSPFDEADPAAAKTAKPAGQRGWDDVDDFSAPKGADIADPGFDEFDPDAFQALEKPARSYRIQPKRRFDFTTIGLGLLGLVIVAGAGYGAWTLRDTLSGLVTGLVSNPPAEETAKPSTTKPVDNANKPQADAKPATNAAVTEPVEPEVQKFTQRLRADGTEVDEGKANGTGDGEGKTVAEQTVASTAPETTPAPLPNSKVENQAPIPVGVAQKMFLYEERVGQTSPVAIEGSVVWSVKTETGENGKPETEVQGQVTTPERGLSAFITFKRNFDPSLPASHLVELVFSLPANFDGGGIENVQRVAFKQTEQDRGDALVAVPAKITDDFHMIALNDFADARAFNLKLMQTRDWIDIPIAYRNGRRALLTMQKGTTGTEAFNQALAAWAAEEPAASAAPANPQ